jgi:hypothetical protein
MRRSPANGQGIISQGEFAVVIMVTVVLIAALGIAFGLLGLSRGVVIAISIPIVSVLIALAFRYGPESEVGVKGGSPRHSWYEDRPGTARG